MGWATIGSSGQDYNNIFLYGAHTYSAWMYSSWGAEVAHVDPQPFLAFVGWLAPPPVCVTLFCDEKPKNRIDRVLRSAPQLLVQQKGVASRRLAHLRQVLGLNASPEAELVSRRVERNKRWAECRGIRRLRACWHACCTVASVLSAADQGSLLTPQRRPTRFFLHCFYRRRDRFFFRVLHSCYV